MGNLREQCFEDIWNSARYLRLREAILDGSYAVCRGAPCPFAAAPEGMCRAGVEALDVPAVVAPGSTARLGLRVTNLGTVPWNARPADRLPTHFMLSCLLYDDERRLLPQAAQRTALPRDLVPGECLEVELIYKAPSREGRYRLGVELARWPVFGFTALGNPVCVVPLVVAGPPAADHVAPDNEADIRAGYGDQLEQAWSLR